MEKRQVQLIYGSLLHDIGKAVQRAGGEGGTHSKIGGDFIASLDGNSNPEGDGRTKDDAIHWAEETEILNCIRYHHGTSLGRAKDLAPDSLAYLSYIADNMASAADRREKQNEGDEQKFGFDSSVPLASVFKVFNGVSKDSEEDGKWHFVRQILNPENPIPYPENRAACQRENDEIFYTEVKRNLRENLRGMEIREEYISSLLSLLEANLSFIPSSTAVQEQEDISLYDHLKLTAAFSECLFQYLEEKNISDYKSYVFEQVEKAWDTPSFLLYSMDVSGIQSFIYTISSKGALKGLRARSFYLEIMMEHVMDELLERLSLSRASLLYQGGGHAYLLLPNTEKIKTSLKSFKAELNQWFLKKFDISLFMADGYAECSANVLCNRDAGNTESYTALYRKVSEEISKQKRARYTAKDILSLNQGKTSGGRECSICHRMENVETLPDYRGEACPICRALESFAKALFQEKKNSFIILDQEKLENAKANMKLKNEQYLPLPSNRLLLVEEEKELIKWMKEEAYVRSYIKNEYKTGNKLSTKLWIADYAETEELDEESKTVTFQSLAKSAKGIERLSVLRADVDDLGASFVSGFRNPELGGRFNTLSRTSTLSRQLSLFFKLYLKKVIQGDKGREHSESEKKLYHFYKKVEAFGKAADGREEEKKETNNSKTFFDEGFWKEDKENKPVQKQEKRSIAVVYSGGDDVFLVGAWNDVIDVALDLQEAFRRFTGGKLHFSAGIGFYSPSFPIHRMAVETGELEDSAKRVEWTNPETHNLEKKNGICLFEEKECYSFTQFRTTVLGEKYEKIERFFRSTNDYGKVFLYRLLEMLREARDKNGKGFNRAKLAYYLSRMEPKDKGEYMQSLYQDFAHAIYTWAPLEKERNELILAIYLYVYLIREREQKS